MRGAFVMLRKRYGDWLLAALAAGAVAGTVMANLLEPQLREQAAGMGSLLAGSVYGNGSRLELMRAAAFQRLGETVLLWGAGLTAAARPLCCLLAAYLGCSAAVVLSVLTCENGMMGLAVYLATVLPQAACYLPVWLFLAGAAGRRMRIPIRYVLAGAVLLAAGIWCEGVISPWLLRGLLRR